MPPEYRHKAFVIGKVLEFAQDAGFSVEPVTALAYVGDGGAHMMHYQFKIGSRGILWIIQYLRTAVLAYVKF
jgi:hypothetical protein